MRQRVHTGEVELAYLESGRTHPRSLVLVHGSGFTADDWDRVAPDFARDHHVFAVDMRGCGDSSWPGEYSLEAWAADLDDFVAVLGLESVTLVGHSAGGVAAMLAAQANPPWLSRLVLEDAPMPTRGWRPPRGEFAPPNRRLGYDFTAFQAITRQLDDPPAVWWERLTDITVPTLMIAGGEGSTIPQESVSAAAQRIRDASLVTIDVGHMVHRDAPKRFIATVREWLAHDAD